MNTEVMKCVDILLNWGITPEMIDTDILEKDYQFWLDVDMVCSFYIERLVRG